MSTAEKGGAYFRDDTVFVYEVARNMNTPPEARPCFLTPVVGTLESLFESGWTSSSVEVVFVPLRPFLNFCFSCSFHVPLY